MNKKNCNIVTIATILLLILASSVTAASLVGTSVERVIDGDTIEITYNAKKESIRLIGVDTPETKHPTKGIQPYGPEASAYTKKALEGKLVWLEWDVEQRDRYGRLLAYVWTAHPANVNDSEIRSKMFNARLLLDGYAQLATFPPNVRYVERFRVYQTEARAATLHDKDKRRQHGRRRHARWGLCRDKPKRSGSQRRRCHVPIRSV